MGDIRLAEGKFEEAMAWAQRSLAVNPADAENYAHLSPLHVKQGRYAESAEFGPRHRNDMGGAIAWAIKAIQETPREAAAHGNLATLPSQQP